MKRLIRIFIFLFVLISAVSTVAQDIEAIDTVSSAQGITIETSVDRAEIYIGDMITYSLSIIHDSDVVLTPPPIGANLGSFDVKNYEDFGETRLESGSIKTESRFMLTTFTTGDYIIPPIPVEFMLPDSTKKILISEPMPIKVSSLLAEGSDTADIRDLKSPIEFKSSWPWWYYSILAAILILIVSLIMWRIFRRVEEEKKPVDTRNPWEIAYEDLAFLKEKNLPAEGEYKQYYVELSDIFREFLQRTCNIPVLDMTTYEFMTAIDEREIDPELITRFRRFLEFADLVKFAKYIPENEKAVSDFDEACNMVDTVRAIELRKQQIPPVMTAAGTTGGGSV